MESYEKILATIRPEISFGVGGIRVYQPDELRSMQVGYSVSPSGEPLTGDKHGDWLTSWVTIGQEEPFGDPIFIDTSEDGFPVYTAMHGEGPWISKRIAVSLEAFGSALSAVAIIAKGSESPVALENNPLTSSEKQVALALIRNANLGIELDFWDVLLS